MIEAVILKISPEMLDALQSVADQDQQIENWLHVNGESIDQGGPAMVSRYGAELMAESWFDAPTLRFFLSDETAVIMNYPAICDDPLVKDFVQTILKIYRLTASV